MGIENFERDLIKFVKEHPYTKEQEASVDIDADDPDMVKMNLHTVNGEYERIQVIINYIA